MSRHQKVFVRVVAPVATILAGAVLLMVTDRLLRHHVSNHLLSTHHQTLSELILSRISTPSLTRPRQLVDPHRPDASQHGRSRPPIRFFKTKSPAVSKVDRPYCLYPNASVWLLVAERKSFLRVTAIPYTLMWRCYNERYNQR